MSFAVVVSDIAPLYTKPEPLCELADEALYGMVVEVLAREGMYCRVRTHYRYEGWTPARCLLEDGALAAQWQSVPKLVVQKPYIDVLNEPKVQGGCLQSMPRGAFLCPEGGPDENQWQPVRLADGRLGYTKATYLAQQKLEQLKKYDSGTIAPLLPEEVETSGIFNISYAVATKTLPVNNVTPVQVTVSWTEEGKTNTVDLGAYYYHK